MTERKCETCAWGVKLETKCRPTLRCEWSNVAEYKEPFMSCRHWAKTRGWPEDEEDVE